MRYRWSLATIGLLILAACNLLSFVEPTATPTPDIGPLELNPTAASAILGTLEAYTQATVMWAAQHSEVIVGSVTLDATDSMRLINTFEAFIHQTETAQPITPSPTNAPCAFMWATQELPELSAEITAAMAAALDVDVNVRAYAFGENCMVEGVVRSFGAMQTDFDISLTLPTLEDRAAVGDTVAAALTVLVNYPPGTTPGPNPGRITFQLIAQTGDETVVLQVNYTIAANAIAQGLSGEALLDALENPQ